MMMVIMMMTGSHDVSVDDAYGDGAGTGAGC